MSMDAAMAKTKLTLTIERDVIERARRFSERNDISISALVTRFLEGLEPGDGDASHSPIVQSLIGVAKGADESDYRGYLERKYLDG